MVQLTLTNHYPDSNYHQAVIDVVAGKCVFDKKYEISLRDLFSVEKFSHPLLNEPFMSSPDHLYHYAYDDIAGLLYAAKFIYTVLLRVENPLMCHFKINPSSHYKGVDSPKKLNFSINYTKPAQGSISITQLEKMIGKIFKFKYKFSEDVIIDDEFTIHDLPEIVDGDLLYKVNEDQINILKFSSHTDRFELRYIDPNIHFGVFSREFIRRGEVISVYTGIKKINPDLDSFYRYCRKEDVLGMMVDAYLSGNIARFINHACKSESQLSTSNDEPYLEANVMSKFDCSNGFEVVTYYASRDISQGEQLLVDYGAQYIFDDIRLVKFKKNGRVKSSIKCKNRFYRFKLNEMRIIGEVGVQAAKTYILTRLFFRALAVLILIGAFLGFANV